MPTVDWSHEALDDLMAIAKGIACDAAVVGLEYRIEVVAAPDAGASIARGVNWFDVQHGGQIDIYITRAATPGTTSQIASERWESVTVSGRPAAVGHAILRDEFGESAVVVWDAPVQVQVVVKAVEVELATLLAIAEAVLR